MSKRRPEDGHLPDRPREVLLLEVPAPPETFPPVSRPASRRGGTTEALAHLDASLKAIRAEGGAVLVCSANYPVALVEVAGAPPRSSQATFLRLRTRPDPTFEDAVAMRLGRETAEAWFRGDISRGELLSQVRPLEEERGAAPSQYDVPNGQGDVPGGLPRDGV